MMAYHLFWTPAAQDDIKRLYNFLADKSPAAADRIYQNLIRSPLILCEHPYIGQKVEHILMNDIRRLIIDDYELRYEVIDEKIIILRIWHGREDR